MSPTLQVATPEEGFSFDGGEDDEEEEKMKAEAGCLEEEVNYCDTEPKERYQNTEPEICSGLKRKLEASEKTSKTATLKRQKEKKLRCTYPNCSAVFGRPDRLQTHIDVNHAHIVSLFLSSTLNI